MKIEDFICKSKKTHGNKYDYSKSIYINSRTKLIITCPTHGDFEQEPSSHIRGRGCPKCGILSRVNKLKNNVNELIKKANIIHNNKYDYSLINYINIDTKVKIICPEHGIFEQSFSAHLRQKQGCPKCFGNYNYTTEEWVKKANIVHNNKYDYSLTKYIQSSIKVKIICPEHGIFEQKPFTHLRGSKCPKCSGVYNYTTEEWIKRASIIHNNKYDYSLAKYINSFTKVKIICPEHGIFEQLPENHIKEYGCPMCNNSIGEQKILKILKENNIDFEEQKKYKDLFFKKQLKFDFYLPKYNLLIEYNGRQHYNFISFFDKTRKDFLESRHRDWLKRKYAKHNNINLLTIPYWEFNNLENILKSKLNI